MPFTVYTAVFTSLRSVTWQLQSNKRSAKMSISISIILSNYSNDLEKNNGRLITGHANSQLLITIINYSAYYMHDHIILCTDITN